VFFGMPPYTYWQQNPAIGRIPPHRTDTGAFLVSEVFGARSMIYIKDEDGLFTADPKKDKGAKFVPRISAGELASLNLGDLVVERAVLEFLPHAEHRRSIQIINGLKPGLLTRALEGEHVGTLITAE
jgi:molybdenum storage protein